MNKLPWMKWTMWIKVKSASRKSRFGHRFKNQVESKLSNVFPNRKGNQLWIREFFQRSMRQLAKGNAAFGKWSIDGLNDQSNFEHANFVAHSGSKLWKISRQTRSIFLSDYGGGLNILDHIYIWGNKVSQLRDKAISNIFSQQPKQQLFACFKQHWTIDYIQISGLAMDSFFIWRKIFLFVKFYSPQRKWTNWDIYVLFSIIFVSWGFICIWISDLGAIDRPLASPIKGGGKGLFSELGEARRRHQFERAELFF